MTTTAAILAALTTLRFQTSDARAGEAYCAKAKARTNADAALLLAPRLFAQILRYPQDVDIGPATNGNLQLRVGLSYSPLDAFRGLKVMGIGEADCRAFESGSRLGRSVTDGLDGIFAAAHRAEIAYLGAQREEWRALLERARQRLNARTITVVEFEEFARAVGVFEHRLEEARAQVARVDARGTPGPVGGLGALETAYVEDRREFERRQSNLRRMDDWSFRVVGGAMPTLDRRVGWFGWIEASYNLGGLFQGPQENKYLRMRMAEIQEASYEYPARLRLLREEARAVLEQAQHELVLVSDHLSLLAHTKALLAAAVTSAADQERDVLAARVVLTTADQLYWSSLVNHLVAFLKD